MLFLLYFGFIETLPVKRNVSSCISTDHDLPTSNYKPLEDLELSFFHSTRIIRNTISAANKNIWQTDCRVKDLTNTSESYRQEMQNCAEKRMQVEAQIKKFQSDANDLQSKEASLKGKLSSLDAELKEVKKLHQKLIDELYIYKNTLEKEIEIQEELKKKQMLEEEKKSQLLAQKQREDENRRQLQQKEELENRNRICQGKDIRRYSHVGMFISKSLYYNIFVLLFMFIRIIKNGCQCCQHSLAKKILHAIHFRNQKNFQNIGSYIV